MVPSPKKACDDRDPSFTGTRLYCTQTGRRARTSSLIGINRESGFFNGYFRKIPSAIRFKFANRRFPDRLLDYIRIA
jgi:hypothetical protein